MRILQVSTADIAGGAEKVAWSLNASYRALGHEAWLAVGLRRTDDPNVLLMPNDSYRNPWARLWLRIGSGLSPMIGKVRGAGRLGPATRWIGQPRRLLDVYSGREDFDFPGTRHLLDATSMQPQIVHCHNLHGDWLPAGGYFDLRALPRLSKHVPVVVTLHDAWLLSGHCAHSFDCERWRTGCGACPDLTIPPAVRRDATAFNWQRKRAIYANSRLYVATPCKWLMQKVQESVLAPAAVEARIIANGIDLSVFRPTNRQAVRAALGLPADAAILLFAANGIRQNVWKDYDTVRKAVSRIATHLKGAPVVFVALGEEAPSEQIGPAQVRFVPYQSDPRDVARYYQAADVYVHAARADTFPNVILEALACGTPVVATAVGGIPEQVQDGITGFCVQPQDAEEMTSSIMRLLSNRELLSKFGEAAIADARQRFDLGRQVADYLAWYSEIRSALAARRSRPDTELNNVASLQTH